MSVLDQAKAQAVFLQHLRDLRFKDRSITAKLSYLSHFFRFAAETGLSDLREVTAVHIHTFLESERSRISARTRKPVAGRTLSALLASVRLLFGALYQAEMILTNPTRGVRLVSQEKSRLRAVFTESQIARFLDSIDIHQALGLRDRAMFELAYSSGLRCGELCKLDRRDIDLASRMLIVREAKWAKDRVVPINEPAAEFLLLYLGRESASDRPVFLGPNGRMNPAYVRDRFRVHLAAAGLRGRGLSPHSIRHATATHLLAHGADLRYVQELLGHESIQTTVVYTNELFENLKRIYRRYHPRENSLYREVDAVYRRRIKRLLKRLEDPRRPSNRRWRRKEGNER